MALGLVITRSPYTPHSIYLRGTVSPETLFLGGFEVYTSKPMQTKEGSMSP